MVTLLNRFEGEYPQNDGGTPITDARFLIVVFFLLIIAPFFMNSYLPLTLMLGYVLLLHLISRLPIRLLGVHLKRIIFFVVLVMALNMVFVRGESAGLPSPFSFLSKEGIRSGCIYGLRILLLYITAATFLCIASQERLAGGLAALVAPISRTLARKIALYGFVSIGFLPVFSREIQRIHIVQYFRGGALRGRLLQRLAATRLMLVPLLISAIHRSEHMAMTIELRQLKERVDVLIVIPKTGKWDVFWLVVSVGVVAAALYLLNG